MSKHEKALYKLMKQFKIEEIKCEYHSGGDNFGDIYPEYYYENNIEVDDTTIRANLDTIDYSEILFDHYDVIIDTDSESGTLFIKMNIEKKCLDISRSAYMFYTEFTPFTQSIKLSSKKYKLLKDNIESIEDYFMIDNDLATIKFINDRVISKKDLEKIIEILNELVENFPEQENEDGDRDYATIESINLDEKNLITLTLAMYIRYEEPLD